MAASENDIKIKIILDIDGVLSDYNESLFDIPDAMWREFFFDNKLHLKVWEKIDVLSPATLPFIVYLIKKKFDIYFSTARFKENTIPYLEELNRRLADIMGENISLDLKGNRVFTQKDLRDGQYKDIAQQLNLKQEELFNACIVDDTPENIENSQWRFALKMRDYDVSWMSNLKEYAIWINGDQHYMARKNLAFQKLNGLYYAVGLIETVLENIEKGDKRNFEDILFELQFKKSLNELNEYDLNTPPSHENTEYYMKGLSVLRNTMAPYNLGYSLDLILPSTYRPDSQAAKKVKSDVAESSNRGQSSATFVSAVKQAIKNIQKGERNIILTDITVEELCDFAERVGKLNIKLGNVTVRLAPKEFEVGKNGVVGHAMKPCPFIFCEELIMTTNNSEHGFSIGFTSLLSNKNCYKEGRGNRLTYDYNFSEKVQHYRSLKKS